MMNQKQPTKINARIWIRLPLRMAGFAVAILWPAGTWLWWEAWALIGAWLTFVITMAVLLRRHDPALLAERMKSGPVQEGQKTWDKVLLSLMFLAGFGNYIIPGLDVMRFGWSEPFPVWIKALALAAHVPCFLFIGWVMYENTFLSPVVKIDDERGHQVITTGPYALVRHPMYSAIIILLFALPVALGSRFGLIPAALMAALLIVRTYLEDRTLHEELSGYPEYAKTTRYRLIPGIW